MSDEPKQPAVSAPAKVTEPAETITGTRIGSLRAVGNQRLLIPQSRESWMFFVCDGEAIKLNLIFTTDDEPTNPKIKAEGQGDHATLSFYNWTNSFGMSTKEPIRIGTNLKNQPILLMAASRLIGDTRIIEIQVMFDEGAQVNACIAPA
jgi:hypothetical protein